MNLFKRKSNLGKNPANQAALAEMALRTIHDGVVITDKDGVIGFINPAATTMTGCGSAEQALGLDYGLVIRLESKEGREFSEAENPLIQAMRTTQVLDSFQACLIVAQSDKRIPVSISVLPGEGMNQNRIIVFRDITKELQEEGEQAEFISTASHEMRTPVATIDGYLSLCLNPQTATIDERAHGYLAAAQAASKHLGKLFQDLLDATKLDDGHIRPTFEPVEMVELAKTITNDYLARAREGKIKLEFGSDKDLAFGESRRLGQVVYGFVDVNFMREILDNLLDNALKYTPEGGSIYVNVRGDGDRILINVTDTGIGISPDDLTHIFQKFYRADNSDTRTIGGTGLGLYLVKQRVTAMGGKVWAESAFGEGSTFYVSLPRLTNEEYEKRMIVVRNRQIQAQPAPQPAPQSVPQPAVPVVHTAPAAAPTPAPAQMPVQPVPQPAVLPAPQPAAPTIAQLASQPAPLTASQAQAPPGPPAPPPVSTPVPAPNPPVQQVNNNLNGEIK